MIVTFRLLQALKVERYKVLLIKVPPPPRTEGKQLRDMPSFFGSHKEAANWTLEDSGVKQDLSELIESLLQQWTSARPCADERLFRSTISFEDQWPTHKTWVDMRVAPKAMLWWDTSRSQQDNLWESWVRAGRGLLCCHHRCAGPSGHAGSPGVEAVPLAVCPHRVKANTLMTAQAAAVLSKHGEVAET